MKLFTLTQIPVYLVICYSAGKLWGITSWPSYQAQQICALPLSFSNFNFVFLTIDNGGAHTFGIVNKTLSSVTIGTNGDTFNSIFWLDIGI